MTGSTTVKVLLVGNGPFSNLGCEAIVRGTMEILRAGFSKAVVAQNHELDLSRGTMAWFLRHLTRACGYYLPGAYPSIDREYRGAAAALQIGGDNYTLDYGSPEAFLRIDRYLLARRVPLFLWGASVGPFHAQPRLERDIARHLARFRAVFVRETLSRDYLLDLGVKDNLVLMADPAFLLRPAEPCADKLGFVPPPGAIGLNLSPLMAAYRNNGNLAAWFSECVRTAGAIRAATQRPVVFVPHVYSSQPLNDDQGFMSALAEELRKTASPPVLCPASRLTAGEAKWLISRCECFVGARTHATIAAFSSGVPTLSLAYSRKAAGLNKDLFGDLRYCVDAEALVPGLIAERLAHLVSNADGVRERLRESAAEMSQRAMRAGAILAEIVRKNE